MKKSINILITTIVKLQVDENGIKKVFFKKLTYGDFSMMKVEVLKEQNENQENEELNLSEQEVS